MGINAWVTAQDIKLGMIGFEENDIQDDSACSTTSNSFNKGCKSFVNGGSGTISRDDSDDEDEDDE
jgi:hypothetical protein